jgi:hypothetical protein
MIYKTKNDCVHKFNGKSMIIVVSIKGNKYYCKCLSCQQEFILKKKQIPVDVNIETAKEE